MSHKKIIFKISGMTCASCAASNEKALAKTEGILSANVNIASKKALVEYDPQKINEEEIKKVIEANGYHITELSHNHAHGVHNEHEHEHEHKEDIIKNWQAFLWSAIFSIPLLLEMIVKLRAGMTFFGNDLIMWLHLMLATAVVLYFGWRFHKMAFVQAKKLQANMDTLISMGTLTAYFYSLWAFFVGKEGYLETAAIIIVLILLGKYLEAKSTGQASEAMRKLMEVGAKKARILKDGKEEEVDISEVKIGDVILIKPSEKIPLDGKIIEGSSSIDESMLTGESMPVEKEIGAEVFGGTLNIDGVVKIKVTEVGEGTVLAEIIRTMEEAQGSKAPIQKLADRISGIFVPIVIVLALSAFLSWYLVLHDFSLALINAVSVLVIACPCALGLATPAAIMVGTGKGAKSGILFKSGESFERAKNISMVVFDKTGTLTKGMPEVQKIISNPSYGFPEEKILKIAASIAKNSQHPLSRAVEKHAKEKNILLTIFNGVKELQGKGVTARCAEHKVPVALGNIKVLEEIGADTKWANETVEDEKIGIGSRLFVTHDNKVIGVIIVADEARNESKKVITDLKKIGLKVAMITGDNEKTAEVIAGELGIDQILAEVMPDQKSKELKRLQEKGEKVVFVGDGINDAPSLIQADLGIAMGSATDIAKEAGQIILMQNNLEKVVEAINLSQKTFRTIKQNLFWAFFYNIVAIPLAAFGFLSPAIAAGAMSLSSVSVVLNSLRISK